jgi:SdrD B-like domain
MTLNNLKIYLLILLAILISFAVFGSINTKAISEFTNVSLTGYVWEDYNLNGAFDEEEVGINNLKITVVNPLTQEIITTTDSNIDGKYIITGINGTYDIKFADPEGYELVNTSKVLAKIENNTIKNIQLTEQVLADRAVTFNVPFVSSTNPNLVYNKWFNKDFDDKFNANFNAQFNAKFNEDFNKIFNIGYQAGLNKTLENKNEILIDK